MTSGLLANKREDNKKHASELPNKLHILWNHASGFARAEISLP